MSALARDLRYTLAPLHARAVYAQLFAARASIADVLALGHDPVAVAARVLGVERDEATRELEALRALGLVGDGLTLLAGSRTRRRSATGEHAADVEPIRAALAAYEGSRRALARDLGCTEGALRAFASGRRSLGGKLLSALGAYLGVRTNECVPTSAYQTAIGTHVGTQQVGTQFGTQPLPPSDSLSPSLESSLSSEISEVAAKSSEESETEGEGPGEGTAAPEVRTSEYAPNEPPAPSKRRRSMRKPITEDATPPEGTLARRAYNVLTSDTALAPIVSAPGDLSMRLAALVDGTQVDLCAELIAAGLWQARNGGWTVRGVSAGLLRWIRTAVERSRSMPSGVARPSTTARTDFQGRVVAAPAALPDGDVWQSDRDEEAEAFAAIHERTQPKGRTR